MAGYDSTKLSLLMPRIGGTGQQIWTYQSVDAAASVDASGYITDGGSRGMKVGDLVLVMDNDDTNYITTGHTVVTVSSTYPGAVDLSNGTTLGGGSNTD